MKRIYTTGTTWAALAALAVLLVAWFVPLPPIIAGEEALAAQTIPTDRSNTQTASQRFQDAQSHYQSYIKSHDLGALLQSARKSISEAKAAPDDIEKLVAVRDVASQVSDYANVLHDYAQASEQYFQALHNYDDKLMSWTRALGAASESLRTATFPFVEHLKLYPEPVGQKADPSQVSAAQVAAQIESLRAHVAALSPDPNPHATRSTTTTTLGQIDQDITNIWASGRSVEYVAGLHNDYYAMLRTYDQQVQAQANSPDNTGPTGGRRVLANALTVLLGALTLGGMAALFMPHSEKEKQT